MKKLYALIVIFISFFLLIKPVFAQNDSLAITGEHIQSHHVDISILQTGEVTIQESIKYDFGTSLRHGITREIPYIVINDEGKEYKLDVTIESIIDENNNKYSYVQNTSDDEILLKIGSADEYVSGIKTYIMRYRIAGAIRYFSDHDEFHWNAIGHKTKVPVYESKVNVRMPRDITEDMKTLCYVGVYGSKETCSIQKDNNIFTFASQRVLKATEGITVIIGFPKGMVGVLEAEELVSFEDTLAGKILILIFLAALIMWYILYPLWIPFKWYRYGRDPNIGPNLTSYYEGPKTKKGRVLSPAETGALVDETVHTRDVMSIVVDLARRGFLAFDEKKKNEMWLEKKKSNSDTLLDFEKELYEDLFEEGESVKLKDVDLSDTFISVKEKIYEHLINNDFFPKNPEKTRNHYVAMSVLGFVTMNIPLLLSSLIFGRVMPRKTLYGGKEALKAKGLLNFLKSQDRILEFEAKKYFDFKNMQTLFENLLPYAVAFGVEKVWMNRFKDINLMKPEWYNSYKSETFTTSLLHNSLHSSMNSFSSAATPVRSTQGFSSGFSSSGSSGGGGGFSGSGGGGGGVGSW